MVRLDLHVHSDGSYDSALTRHDIRKALKDKLDCIAITDHNTVDSAISIQNAIGKDKIIVGEEINTEAGEIIGLFLKKVIKPGLPLRKTAELVKKQDGLVYIPHPFERQQRHGLSLSSINEIADLIDIFETYNSRTISLIARARARRYAINHNLAEACSSDAHGPVGLGSAMKLVDEVPTAESLVGLLRKAKSRTKPLQLRALLEPSAARRKRAKKSKDTKKKAKRK